MQLSRVYVLPAVAIVLLAAWIILSPPRFWLNWTKPVEPTAATGAQLVAHYGCRDCHKIAGEGALKAPSLDGIIQSAREDPRQTALRLWLRNPGAVDANTAMPNFHLSDSEIEAIVAYLNESGS